MLPLFRLCLRAGGSFFVRRRAKEGRGPAAQGSPHPTHTMADPDTPATQVDLEDMEVSSSEEEEEEESSEAPSSSVTPPLRVLPSRATRGLRMVRERADGEVAMSVSL